MAKLTRLLIAAALCLVMTVTVAMAYKFGDFPGKGSRDRWLRANDQLNVGLHLARAGKYNKAIPSIQSAINIYPHDASYFFNLAVCYENRDKPGDMERAERLYRESIKLAPGVWETWNGLATPLASLHKYGEARSAKLKALQCGPPVADANDIKLDVEAINTKLRSISSGH